MERSRGKHEAAAVAAGIKSGAKPLPSQKVPIAASSRGSSFAAAPHLRDAADRSIERDVGVENDLLPFLVFGPREGCAFGQARAARGEAELGERFFQILVGQRLGDAAVELVQYIRRHLRRRANTEP